MTLQQIKERWERKWLRKYGVSFQWTPRHAADWLRLRDFGKKTLAYVKSANLVLPPDDEWKTVERKRLEDKRRQLLQAIKDNDSRIAKHQRWIVQWIENGKILRKQLVSLNENQNSR